MTSDGQDVPAARENSQKLSVAVRRGLRFSVWRVEQVRSLALRCGSKSLLPLDDRVPLQARELCWRH